MRRSDKRLHNTGVAVCILGVLAVASLVAGNMARGQPLTDQENASKICAMWPGKGATLAIVDANQQRWTCSGKVASPARVGSPPADMTVVIRKR